MEATVPQRMAMEMPGEDPRRRARLIEMREVNRRHPHAETVGSDDEAIAYWVVKLIDLMLGWPRARMLFGDFLEKVSDDKSFPVMSSTEDYNCQREAWKRVLGANSQPLPPEPSAPTGDDEPDEPAAEIAADEDSATDSFGRWAVAPWGRWSIVWAALFIGVLGGFLWIRFL